MHSGAADAKPWEKLLGESGAAYEAFSLFLHAGPSRTVSQTARMLGKRRSLLCRWVGLHQWWERALAWDRETTRRDDEALREERENAMRRRIRLAQQLEAVGLALLGTLVRKDPETGELHTQGDVRPRDAVLILKLAAELQDRAAVPGDAGGVADSLDGALHQLDSRELQRLIGLAQEQADSGCEEG